MLLLMLIVTATVKAIPVLILCRIQGAPEKQNQEDVYIEKMILRNQLTKLWTLASPNLQAGPASWSPRKGLMLPFKSEGHLLPLAQERSAFVPASPSANWWVAHPHCEGQSALLQVH